MARGTELRFSKGLIQYLGLWAALDLDWVVWRRSGLAFACYDVVNGYQCA